MDLLSKLGLAVQTLEMQDPSELGKCCVLKCKMPLTTFLLSSEILLRAILLSFEEHFLCLLMQSQPLIMCVHYMRPHICLCNGYGSSLDGSKDEAIKKYGEYHYVFTRRVPTGEER